MPANTQSFVPIKEVRDDIIIRDDGIYCGILLVSSINFALKSTDEQDAILYQFQSILDSLEVSTQILIRSRHIDITPYTDYMRKIKDKQQNELLRLQTEDYIRFIEHFTSTRDIMSKTFFVVVNSASVESTSTLSSIFGSKSRAPDDEFEQNKFQLLQRMSFVGSGLRSLGLRSTQLGDDYIIDVLQQTFNPTQQETLAN